MIPPVGAASPLGSDALISPIGGLGSSAQIGASNPAGASGGTFSQALTGAVNSLQSSVDTANTAGQGLATGAVTDPTQAITAVENAQIAMELASQISSKATQDVQTIFSTQL